MSLYSSARFGNPELVDIEFDAEKLTGALV
jgi:hypothetical protein